MGAWWKALSPPLEWELPASPSSSYIRCHCEDFPLTDLGEAGGADIRASDECVSCLLWDAQCLPEATA